MMMVMIIIIICFCAMVMYITLFTFIFVYRLYGNVSRIVIYLCVSTDETPNFLCQQLTIIAKWAGSVYS